MEYQIQIKYILLVFSLHERNPIILHVNKHH